MDKSETYKRHCCPHCGIIYYLHEDFENRRRESKRTFYCPSGHSIWFPAKTEAEELQEQVQNLRDSLQHEIECCSRVSEEAEHLRHSRNGMKGKLRQVQRQLSTNGEQP